MARPAEYVAALVEVFAEVWRVLKPTGVIFVNLGDAYAGAGYSNHKNTGGALRSDGGKQRHMTTSGCKPKDLIGIPWMVAFALRAFGWYLRSEIVWAKGASFCETWHGSVMPESVRAQQRNISPCGPRRSWRR